MPLPQRGERESLFEAPGFLRQHDRDAVADRIRELGRTRNQLLLLRVILEGRLGDRANQDLEQLRVDGMGGAVGWRRAHGRTVNTLGRLTATASRLPSWPWRARSG